MKFALTLVAFFAASTIYACDGGCGSFSSCGGCSDSFSSCGGCSDSFSSCGGCSNSFSSCGGCSNSFSGGDGVGNGFSKAKVAPKAVVPPAIPIPTPPKAVVPPVPDLPQAIPIEPTKKATIRVQVPADAIVVVNGKQTTTTGEVRTYVTTLNPDYVYDYKIVVWVKRNGVWHYQTKNVQLGETKYVASLAFALPANTDERLATTERSER